MRGVLGILGGMGPLASTAFLQTIYDVNLGDKERVTPKVILYSMPNIPDRTNTLKFQDSLYPLSYFLQRLNELPVNKIVVCCVTAHYLLDKEFLSLSDKLISLIDVMEQEIDKQKTPALLLASEGSYQKELLSTNKKVITPSKLHQDVINNLICTRLKKGKDIELVHNEIFALLNYYGTDTYIAGCTEFHILTKHIISNEFSGMSFIDPLMVIANNLENFLTGITEDNEI